MLSIDASGLVWTLLGLIKWLRLAWPRPRRALEDSPETPVGASPATASIAPSGHSARSHRTGVDLT